MRTILTAVMAALSLTACAGMAANSARNASVSKLGCPNDEIQVSHVDYASGVMSWEATCRGEVIVCSAISGNPNNRTQVECRPLKGAHDAREGSDNAK